MRIHPVDAAVNMIRHASLVAYALGSVAPQLPAQCSAPDLNANVTVDWVNRLISAIGEDESCRVDGPRESLQSSACNIFVGRVLERVYGVKDFVVTPPDPTRKFYRANEVATLLQAGVWKKWTDLGTADAQAVLINAKSQADAGRLVIALWRNPDGAQPGHMALVGPGPLTASAKWRVSTPVAAQFHLETPADNWMGKPLACSFGSDKKGAVHLWVRNADQ
jgi:hypothetical protein